MSRIRKFFESGKKPEPNKYLRGARPPGSAKPTVVKKTKKVNKKNQFSKAVEKSQLTAKKRTQFGEAVKKSQQTAKVNQKKVKTTKTNTNNNRPKILQGAIDPSGKVNIKKIDTIQKGQAAAKALGLNPGAGVYYDKKAGRMQAAVTAEELEKSGLSLQDYLNKQRGLTRRKFGGIAIKGVKEKISIT